MALAIGAILALLAILVAAYPFWRRKAANDSGEELNADAGPESPTEPIHGPDQLDTIYEAIRTLQLEREIGNIPEGLYREQMNLYRRQAAFLLRDYDREQAGNTDWALEEEIKVARAALNSAAVSDRPCPNCSRPVREGAAVCPECNAPIDGSLDGSIEAESASAGSAPSTLGNDC